MADKLLKSGKYGVTELRLPVNIENRVQDVFFGTLTEVENGMFVKYDYKTGVMATGALTDDLFFVHSVPKLYEKHLNSSDYVMTPDGFMPRIQRYGIGTVIATDNVVVDDTVFADFDAVATYLATEANKVYGYVDATTKVMRIAKTVPATTCMTLFEITKVTTMKTGTPGVEAVKIAASVVAD